MYKFKNKIFPFDKYKYPGFQRIIKNFDVVIKIRAQHTTGSIMIHDDDDAMNGS
jgi:hypothetical protein